MAAQITAEVVAPVRGLASRTIDEAAVLLGGLGPGSISDRVIGADRKRDPMRRERENVEALLAAN